MHEQKAVLGVNVSSIYFASCEKESVSQSNLSDKFFIKER